MLPFFAGFFAGTIVGTIIPSETLDKKEQGQQPVILPPPPLFEIQKEAATVFSQYTEKLPKQGVPLDYVLTLAVVSDTDGKPYLSPEEILMLYREKVPATEANILLHFTGKDNRPLFTAKELVKTTENCSLEEAVALAGIRDVQSKTLLSGFEVYRMCQLQLTEEDLYRFPNTKKPNALIIYPTYDENSETKYGAFEYEKAIRLFQKIQTAYDVRVVFAGTEDEVYAALSTVPDIELLVLTGHGNTTTLALGKNTSQQNSNSDIYTIDTTDTEWEYYFKRLHPNATIFLNSCSTGEYGNQGNNLANFIRDAALGRKVIAATEVFYQDNIEIISLYPFDIKIVRDITYTTKK